VVPFSRPKPHTATKTAFLIVREFEDSEFVSAMVSFSELMLKKLPCPKPIVSKLIVPFSLSPESLPAVFPSCFCGYHFMSAA
jgi:hypothetical protein